MKKLLVLILTLIMAVSLVACGGGSEEAAASPATDSAPSADPASSADPDPSADLAPVADPSEDASKQEANFVTMKFGDITMSVPDVFNPVSENQGVFVSGGPNASITVTPATEIDLLPSEWDESLAAESLDMLYGSTYTDIELSVFEGDVNMNGNTAVYMGFYGVNAQGVDRLVQVVRLYNSDQTELYVITLMHSADDAFFTPEVGGKIINSITLEAE